MRCARGLEVQGRFIPHLIKPVQQLLIFVGVNFLVYQILGTSCGDQEKEVMGCSPEFNGNIQNFFNVPDIMPGDCGVDLELKATALEQFYSI